MLTEVQVDNRDASLLPGMYAEVKPGAGGCIHVQLYAALGGLAVM